MDRWKQVYLIATLSRIGLTLDQGRVASKRESMEWAARTWPERWRPLIERAIAERPDPWRRFREEADGALIDETLAFVSWVSRTIAGTVPAAE